MRDVEGGCVSEGDARNRSEESSQESTQKRRRREPVPRSELPPDHWNVDNVAAFAGRSKDWVYTQVALGEMPHSKRGGILYFDPETVSKWLVGKPVAVPSKGKGH